MSDRQAIQALQEQLASDEEKLKELQRRDEELLQNIPEKGFHAAAEHVHLQSQMDVLYELIREKEHELAMAKSNSQRRLGIREQPLSSDERPGQWIFATGEHQDDLCRKHQGPYLCLRESWLHLTSLLNHGKPWMLPSAWPSSFRAN